MHKAKKCFTCKQEFRPEELVYYTPLTAKSGHYYCAKCLEAKHQREHFSDAVCIIFGTKSPGPRIWSERQRLLEAGYTDNIIIDCLDYVYNVKHYKIYAESLCVVTPEMISEMLMYKRKQREDELKTQEAMNMKTEAPQIKKIVVKPRENKGQKKKLNPDDFLDN